MERIDRVDLGNSHFAGLLGILQHAKCCHCGDPITGESVYFYQWIHRGEAPHLSRLLIFDKPECLIEKLREDSLRAVNDIGEIPFENKTIHVITIGIAAADIQFLLLNDINEVMSVGYFTNEGEVTWKFGKPHDHAIPEIVKYLRERFCET